MLRDTHPDTARIRREALARCSPEERLREALALSEAVKELERLGFAQRSRSDQVHHASPAPAPPET